mgnify:CR=1 FL=1
MSNKIEEIVIPENEYFDNLGINSSEFSVLALSVYKANFDFINKYKKGKILEIGCGSDSVIQEKINSNWHGIDVAKKDRHGKPSLASKFGSVHDIPYDSGLFDYVISNQSIEHWYEYNIEFLDAFKEINRVTKINGYFIFNFPIHLHGHKYFVLNKLSEINKKLVSSGFEIENIKKFTFKNKNYEGWLKCGFPTLYLKMFSPDFQKTSFIMEYKIKKIENIYNSNDRSNLHKKKLQKSKSRLSKRLHHGLLVLLYNIIKKILKW